MSVALSDQLSAVLHLASASLPVGAYSYSQGLESAIASGQVFDEESARSWIGDHLRLGVARGDAPVLVRLQDAWSRADEDAVERWNAFSLASRDTRELRAETEQMGASLARLLVDLALLPSEEARVLARLGAVSFPTSFALAAVLRGVESGLCVHAFLWSWLEAQLLAAVKTVPLGQRAGQRVLVGLAIEIPGLVRMACEAFDDEITTMLPSVAILSAAHESAPARLFRS